MTAYNPLVASSYLVDEDSFDLENCTRSDEFWFPTGNIILQVGNTQFRVHLSRLTIQSALFEDMYTLLKPVLGAHGLTSEAPCHAICMYDEVKDWTALLRVLHDGYVDEKDTRHTSNYHVISLLRLTHKYKFDGLREWSAQRLKENLLVTFGLCENSAAAVTPQWHTNRPRDCQHDFDLLNVVLEVGLHTVLPAVYLLCLRDHEMSAIYQGEKREDGTVAHLSSKSQFILLAAKDKIRQVTRQHTSKILSGDEFLPAQDCKTRDSCRFQRRKLYENLVFNADGGRSLQVYPVPPFHKFCDCCQMLLKQGVQESTEAIWEQLPSYLGLPNWQDLRDFET